MTPRWPAAPEALLGEALLCLVGWFIMMTLVLFLAVTGGYEGENGR